MLFTFEHFGYHKFIMTDHHGNLTMSITQARFTSNLSPSINIYALNIHRDDQYDKIVQLKKKIKTCFYNNNIFLRRYVINMSIMQDISKPSSIREFMNILITLEKILLP